MGRSIMCFSSQTMTVSSKYYLHIKQRFIQYFSVFTLKCDHSKPRLHPKPQGQSPICFCLSFSCATKIGNAFCIKWLREVSHALAGSSACAEGCFVILLLHLAKKNKKNSHFFPPVLLEFKLLSIFYEQTSKP